MAITWSQPEAAVMLSMFAYYDIPAFALGGRHVSAHGPMVTALQGIHIRVAAAAADDALDLLADVAEQPAAIRPYALASPGLYRLLAILALAATLLTPVVLALADPLDENALVSVMLMSPLLLVFNGALPRTSSTFFLGNRARRPAET